MTCRWLQLCVVCVGLLLIAMPAEAGKPFTESSLLGTFAFTEIHVRASDTDGIAHCSGYGTITFHGDGTGYMEGAELCSDKQGALENYQSGITYELQTGYFFVILVPDDPDTGPTQCQLVQKDTMFLCDGTQREAEMLSFQAVGVKQ